MIDGDAMLICDVYADDGASVHVSVHVDDENGCVYMPLSVCYAGMCM